ncbi:MAG TPA: GH116 family glycosyl hydrolase [Bryobacteraceae bacterium]|nr:GH116 family glycosyl hydrolase [Bryobacteraceae bacterium]
MCRFRSVVALSSVFLFASGLGAAASLEISRSAHPWEFLDATGQRASILGKEDGSAEAYVYPLKLFADLRFSFEIEGRIIPGSAIARRVVSHPGSVSLIYTGDEFRVVETLLVPVQQAGGIIRLQIQTHSPLTVRFTLHPDFQLMWPASFGSAFGQWNANGHLFVMGADGQPYAAVLGGTDLSLDSADYATNYSSQSRVAFSLGTVNGSGTRILAFGGSMKSRGEAQQIEANLLQNAAAIEKDTNDFYNHYLSQTVSVTLPDRDLQTAYDWSRLSLVKGMVENPFLGKGLVAGYGLSKGAYRPGFAWFFGRDSFWSSFAFNSDGDWSNSRDAIAFIAKFQRDDGKVPHEISQSASQIAWAKDYPYEYASADATPLFITAVRDYVEHSGDKSFAILMWPRVVKAMQFSRSTFDANGFPKNFGVGHGWVEGGPLLPVRVELYLAGCYVEAVRSLSQLAQWTGHAAEAKALSQEATEKTKKLDSLFWLNSTGSYAFAIGTDGKPVDEPTVLALVPEWWSLLNLDHAQTMISHLAAEDHQSDWGMRIISSKAKLYNPSGYHFGSVWPLFTGWASVGEYHAHCAAPAFANLKANSWLALDGAGGNTTEVISGESYSPLSTATPHQIWSAAMVISPVLRGLFGLDVDSLRKHITLAPHLPVSWNDMSLRHVRLGTDGYIDFSFHRDSNMLTLQVINHSTGAWRLTFSPAYSRYTAITAVTLQNAPVHWTNHNYGTDWHPTIESTIPPSGATLRITHRQVFGIEVPAPPPQLAEPSSNLKLLSKTWSADNKSLQIIVSGLAGKTYELPAVGLEYATQITGGVRGGNFIQITMPAGTGYISSTISIHLQ